MLFVIYMADQQIPSLTGPLLLYINWDDHIAVPVLNDQSDFVFCKIANNLSLIVYNFSHPMSTSCLK